MASNLSRADRNLLTSGKTFRIGNKPYENGVFGTNERDFIYFQLASTDGSVIESRNLSFDKIDLILSAALSLSFIIWLIDLTPI